MRLGQYQAIEKESRQWRDEQFNYEAFDVVQTFTNDDTSFHSLPDFMHLSLSLSSSSRNTLNISQLDARQTIALFCTRKNVFNSISLPFPNSHGTFHPSMFVQGPPSNAFSHESLCNHMSPYYRLTLNTYPQGLGLASLLAFFCPPCTYPSLRSPPSKNFLSHLIQIAT